MTTILGTSTYNNGSFVAVGFVESLELLERKVADHITVQNKEG